MFRMLRARPAARLYFLTRAQMTHYFRSSAAERFFFFSLHLLRWNNSVLSGLDNRQQHAAYLRGYDGCVSSGTRCTERNFHINLVRPGSISIPIIANILFRRKLQEGPILVTDYDLWRWKICFIVYFSVHREHEHGILAAIRLEIIPNGMCLHRAQHFLVDELWARKQIRSQWNRTNRIFSTKNDIGWPASCFRALKKVWAPFLSFGWFVNALRDSFDSCRNCFDRSQAPHHMVWCIFHAINSYHITIKDFCAGMLALEYESKISVWILTLQKRKKLTFHCRPQRETNFSGFTCDIA